MDGFAVLLGSLAAKLISFGGALAFVGGYLRGIRPAIFFGVIGAAMEWFLHANLFLPSAHGFLMVPIAMAAAAALGWAVAWAVGQAKQEEG